MQHVTIASANKKWTAATDKRSVLWERKLFKVLSLALASEFGIPVPPTLLLLEMSEQAILDAAAAWCWPLMIRVEYTTIPAEKPLGGIPVYGPEIAVSLSKFLLERECFPVFHPYIDRFKDLYSVGILSTSESSDLMAEIVGKGFDASDLRLGDSVPHEQLRIDKRGVSAIQCALICDIEYARERIRRIQKCRKLRAYIEYANREGKLLGSLRGYDNSAATNDNADTEIPDSYVCIPLHPLKSLCEIGSAIQKELLPLLPPANGHVASMSFVENTGWILWDVYGEWYRR